MEGVGFVKVKNRLIIGLITVCMAIAMFTGCSTKGNESVDKVEKDNGKLKIMTTLFPQYDFTRQIVGDKADVTLLIQSGMESHTYEPTSEDIIKINKADLFVYTGKYMEVWADKILQSVTNDKLKVLDVSKGINLDEDEDAHEEEPQDDHAHEYDPHIWTSPSNAIAMVDNILKELVVLDKENAEYYTQNAEKFKGELKTLSNDFKKVVSEGKRKKIMFGGRFAMHYFTKEFGLEHESAYDTCSTDSEPSVEVLAHMVDDIKKENIPVIYYEELVDPKIARTISEESGAEMLLMHTCHNVSKEDFDRGVTYISLMRQNLENLKKGLN